MGQAYDFVIDQGATVKRYFCWRDPLDLAIDITGWTARMQIRRKIDSTAADLELTSEVEGGGLSINGPAGMVTMTISDNQSTSLANRYIYDLELYSPTGETWRLVEGTIVVSPEVTR